MENNTNQTKISRRNGIYKQNKKVVDSVVKTTKKDTTTIHIMISSSMESAREQVKSQFEKFFNGDCEEIKWGKYCKMFWEKEYSDYVPEHAKTYTTCIKTIIEKDGKTSIFSHQVKTHKNPKYVDNPECEQCYKKVTSVKPYTGIYVGRKQMCSGCIKTQKIIEQMKSKKEVAV